MANVHIFGNSIGYGLHGGEADWTSRLKREADERRLRSEPPYVAVNNHAGPGNLLRHSLDSKQITANVECHRRGRQLGIFAVGSAEACVLSSKGETEPRRSLTDFQKDLLELRYVVTALNKACDGPPFTPLYLSSIPVDKERAQEFWQADIFNDERFMLYDEAVRDHALETQTKYIDLRSGFDSESMLSIDGVHPNEAGGRFLYQRIGAAVSCALAITLATTLDYETETRK